MTYILSDLHGEFEKFQKMLDIIQLSSDDTVYVLGDVLDRGPAPISLYRFIMKSPNIHMIAGNHEITAGAILSASEENRKNGFHPLDGIIFDLLQWETIGGTSTLKEWNTISDNERTDLLSHLESLVPFREIRIEDKNYILVHSGLGNFSPEKELTEYTLKELTFLCPDYTKRYFDNNTFIVSGHTPTIMFADRQPKIYQNNGNICVDCGASYEDGKMACLALETMKEYYV